MTEQRLRIFVSSPGDLPEERRRVDLVVEKVNAEFEGRVHIETVRWETSYYSAHDTFQAQIPEAADCDLVLAAFRGRLGTSLPAGFRKLAPEQPYPSGTAYEVLSAIEARKSGKEQPDIFVFRFASAPSIALDDPNRAEVEAQWQRLKSFFDTWFRSQSGEFLAAFQGYSSTDDFARQVEDCLRKWLAARGFLSQGSVWDRVLSGSPFPGLAAFDADRGAVFFGRDLAIGQAVNRLRRSAAAGAGAGLPFLLVIGASGSGKSSLLRAGLLPRIVQPGTIPEIDLWRPAIVIPGPDPFLSLAESLLADAALGAELGLGAFRSREILSRQISGDVDVALAPIREALERAASQRQKEAGFDAPRPARVLLAVDQAERLLIEADPAKAKAFAALLAALVREGLAYLICVLRSDAYARFQSFDAFRSLREAGATFDLVPPNAAELEEIVVRPVAACEPPLAFEEIGARSLATQLVADAKGGDTLPLLQITLSRLYAAETARSDGILRFADYRGMDVAVTETANEALEALSDLSVVHERVGDVRRAEGDLKAALDAYSTVQGILETLAKAEPTNPSRQRDLSIMMGKVGDVYVEQGRELDATNAFAASLAIAEELVRENPDNTGWRLDLAIALRRVGDARETEGDASVALDAYRRSLAIDESLTKSDPGNVLWRRDLAVADNKLGTIQAELGDAASALTLQQAALAICAALAQADPGNSIWQNDVWVNRNNVGDLMLAQGDLSGSLASYQAAFDIAERQAKAGATDAVAQRRLATSHAKLADVLLKQDTRSAAVEHLKAALSIVGGLVALDPTNMGWQDDFSRYEMALASNGDDAEARFSVVVEKLKTLKSERDLSIEQSAELEQATISLRSRQQAAPRTPAAIDPSTLDAFVGKYRLAWNALLVITREGNHLFAQVADHQKLEIFPESRREFFAQAVAAQVTFLGEGNDKAPGVVVHMGGYDVKAPLTDDAQEAARAQALARRLLDNTPAPAGEAALRRAIEAAEGGQPDYDQMTEAFAQVVRVNGPATKRQLLSFGPLRNLEFVAVEADGGDEYDAQFARATIRCRIVLADDAKIAFLTFRPQAEAQEEDRRRAENAATPGSEVALRHAIDAAQRGEPDYSQMGDALALAVRSKLAKIQQDLRAFGELKTLTFRRPIPGGGGDVFVSRFENAEVEWRIAMDKDGKIGALYYNLLR